jgi:hypothetical protein
VFYFISIHRFSIDDFYSFGRDAAADQATATIRREFMVNMRTDKNALLQHCAVIADVVLVQRSMTLSVARMVLAALAPEKCHANLIRKLDCLMFD